VRQREHRGRQRKEAGDRPLSRAGLSVQVSEFIDEIIRKMRHNERLSQAGLRRRLYRLAQAGRGEMEGTSAKIET
jgi:hypothetical protein